MPTRICLAMSLIALLGACGADGRPVPPPPREEPAEQPNSNITFSGSVGMGVAGGSGSARVAR